jgi:GNAT superfamily N-acetyltransferase
MNDELIKIRSACQSDLGFIVSSWVNSSRMSPFAAGVHMDAQGRLVCPPARVSKGKRMDIVAGEKRMPDRILAPGMTDTVFHYEQKRLVQAIMNAALAGKGNLRCDVACSSEDPDIIVGFACTDQQDGIAVVHFIYVKRDFRSTGIATRLLASAGITRTTQCFFSHQPPHVFDSSGTLASMWKDAWVRKSAWVFNPFIAFHAIKGEQQ